ncbi:MAG: hypothetical protein ACTHN0_05090 [Aquihabitans sp.]
MTIAIVLIVVVAICVVAPMAARRIKHPENIGTDDEYRTGAPSDPIHGDDRPAGPDAEDPPTATPNRFDEPPPPA